MARSAEPRAKKSGTQDPVLRANFCRDTQHSSCLCRGGEALGFPMGRHILDPGDLDHPRHVGAVDAVADEPGGEFAPLVRAAAVD